MTSGRLLSAAYTQYTLSYSFHCPQKQGVRASEAPYLGYLFEHLTNLSDHSKLVVNAVLLYIERG